MIHWGSRSNVSVFWVVSCNCPMRFTSGSLYTSFSLFFGFLWQIYFKYFRSLNWWCIRRSPPPLYLMGRVTEICLLNIYRFKSFIKIICLVMHDLNWWARRGQIGREHWGISPEELFIQIPFFVCSNLK